MARRYIEVVTQRVYLEAGKRFVFALSLDWPGWCRRGRDADGAPEQLRLYIPRYREIVGVDLGSEAIEVIGQVAGTATTEFGAPRALDPWDDGGGALEKRLTRIEVLRQCWSYFDAVVSSAPATLLKGPRDGGRDRDQLVDHVRNAERAYSSKSGLRIAPRTPWEGQRVLLSERLVAPDPRAPWPADFAIRIIAWHVVDHVWEIEEKTHWPELTLVITTPSS